MILRKLALANFSARKGRLALTVAAVALSVSLVVAVTTGYQSAEATVQNYLVQYMGTTDVEVTPADSHGTLDEKAVEIVAREPAVKMAVGRLFVESGLVDEKGANIPARIAEIVGVRRPQDADVTGPPMEQGKWFDVSRGDVAVVDQVVARLCAADAGKTVTLPGVLNQKKMAVVGVVHKPLILAEAKPTIYVPLETLQEFAKQRGKISRVLINLKSDVEPKAFMAGIAGKLEPVQKGLRLRAASETRRDLQKQFESVHFLSYLGGAVSMLAAVFIVFSALSMGVTERQRTLAMLRAIGAYKSQLAGLVVVEGVVLSAVGVAAGVPLGIVWVKILAAWKSDFFASGVSLSWGGIWLGTLGSVAAAFAASLLPAWSASRVSPLEAMAPLAAPPPSRPPVVSALIGLLAIALDPLVIFNPSINPNVKFHAHFATGLPGLFVGFFLLAPMFVWLVDRLGGAAVSRLLGVEPSLLRQQLSGGLWRAAGTCAALMVGLAVFVVMQVEGNTLLSGWRLPDKFPDLFILAPGGLDDAQQDAVRHVQGIKGDEFLPIAWQSAVVEMDQTNIVKDLLPPSTMVLGVDPEKALKMMELEFREPDGRRPSREGRDRLEAQALRIMKAGRGLIVTDEFRQLYGMRVGSTLRLQTPLAGVVDYKVAGVVWSPGIDVMVSMFDMRQQLDQRTATSVFVPMDDMKRDFGVQKVLVFATNLDLGIDKKVLVDRMTENLAKTDAATVAAVAKLAQATRPAPATGASTGLSFPIPFALPDLKRVAVQGLRSVFGQMGLKTGDVRQIKENIVKGFRRVLNLLSTVAFSAMAVAVLGVANTVIASVRSRRWQFGVLRSIGVTRGQLLRMVLAEALLLGLVGCALGLACGFVMAVNANGLSKYLLGVSTPLNPPWGAVLIGAGVVMAMALAASLGPAVRVAREEPLKLLQAGRAAA